MLQTVMLALALAVPPWADAPPQAGPIVTLPKTLSGAAGDLIIVKVESGGDLITWDASDGLTLTHPKPFDPAMKSIAVHAKENGTYALVASIPNGKETRVAICLVTIGPRPPPAPPIPQPGPIDPTPPPAKQLRVLFVYESADKLTKAQSTVLNSTVIRKYLSDHCVKGDDGKTPDYRFFDKDADMTNAGPTIKAMWDAAKPMFTGLPIVIVFDGLKGTAYPLPATEKDCLDLLRKAGGQ